MPEVDEMVISTVGEMCNMIMGYACSSISLTNTNVDITPPTVLTVKELLELKINSSYCISFLLEGMDAIDFNVGV